MHEKIVNAFQAIYVNKEKKKERERGKKRVRIKYKNVSEYTQDEFV